MKKFYLLFLLTTLALLAPWAVVQAEDITLSGNISRELEPGTTYNFFDSGGASGSYSTSQNFTATFTCDGEISINFSSFATESSSSCSAWDYMLIYDGDKSTGELLTRGQTGCSSNLSTGHDYVASSGTMTIEWHSDGSSTAAGWVATITTSAPPACPKPKFNSSHISNITATSADLSWEGTASSGFKVKYRTAAYVDGLDEKFNGSSAPEGWSVHSGSFDEASGTANWTGTSGWNFGTSNGIFDSHARVNIYGNNQRWLVSPLYKQKAGTLTFNLALTAYSGDASAPGTSGLDDKFIVLVQEAGSDIWTVLRKWDNAGSAYVFNNIDHSTKGEPVSIDMSSYNGKNIRIAFYGESTVSNADNNLHIDDISAGIYNSESAWLETTNSNTSMTLPGLTPEKPYEVKIIANCGDTDGLSDESEVGHFTTLSSCEKSTSLAAAEITADAATISWDGAGQSDFNLRYRIKGSGSWNVVSEKPIGYGLSDLEANTLYEVEVQPTCADEDVWSATLEFRTECAPLAADSWSDGFENEDDFRCWTVGNMESTSSSYIPSRGSSYKHDGLSGLQLYAYKYISSYNPSYNTDADGAYAVLPAFNYGEKSLKDFSLSFWARSSSSGAAYNQHLLVGVVNSPDEMSSFVQVADIEVTTSYAQYELNFSAYTGDKQYIVLMAKVDPASSASTKYGQFYVDDLSLFLTPACQPLASIAISDIERRSLKVNLQPKAGLELADNYDLVYSSDPLSEAALDAATPSTISKDNFPYVINNLERETPYYIYVRANCGEDGVSEWVSASATTKGLSACDEVVVGSGAGTSNYVPTNSNYDYSLSEQIYTPAEIGQSGNISSIAFYNSGSEKTRTIDVYMLHTSKAAFESTTDWVHVSEEQKVFSGSVTFEAGAWATITLSSPFAYNGEDNLLIVVDDNSDNYSSGLSCRTFTSGTDVYPVLYKYQDNTNIDPTNTTVTGTRSYAKNQIQFSFCYDLPACPNVSDLAFELVGEGTSEANVTWSISDADYLSRFEIILSNTEILDFDGVASTGKSSTNSTNLTELSAGTHYWVYVRALCESDPADQNSEWVGIDFTTNANCPEVHNLSAALSDLNAVHIAWELAFAEQEKEFQYILSTEELDEKGKEEASPSVIDKVTELDLSELSYNQHYYFYIASRCGLSHSDYVLVEFTTMPSCPAVVNIAADRIEHNLVELSWESAQYASESSWEVGIVGDEEHAQIVNERKAILFGLDPETAYNVYVKAICGESGKSVAALFDVTTAAQPGNCKQVGEGTSTEYGPVCSYYGYERNGYIFTAADGLDRTGNIEALSWSGSAVKSVPVKIYLKNTAETAFSTSSTWNELISDATLVFDASVSTANGWYDVDITDFNYTGENLMILVASNYGGGGNGAVNSPYFNASGSYAHIYGRKDNSVNDDAAISSFSSQGINNHLPNTKFCFEAKACPDVKALAISDITTSSAKASWEPMGSESAWNIFKATEEVTDFSDLSGYTVESVSALSKSFEGLVDDQDYFVYVQPDCSGADFSMVSFRTIASCKTVINPQAQDAYMTAHTASIAWEDPNENAVWGYLIAYGLADVFDLSDENTYQTYDGSDFILKNLSAETEYKFAVKVFCDQEHTDVSRWSEIASFTTLPSCYTPTAVAVDQASITTNSASVSWTDDHDDAGYIVAYGPAASFDINDPATYETANANAKSVELTGLDAATAYTFMVQGDCSSVNEGFSSSWSWPAGSFITACEEIASFPWSENFNSLTAGIPVCWDNSDGTTTEASYKWNYYADGHDGVGLRFNSYSNSSDNTNILKTPTFVIADKALILSFWYKNPAGGDFSVYYSIGDDEPVALATGLTGISSWTQKEITLPNECLNNNVEFLFKGTSNWGNGDAYIYLDDVKLEEVPECVKPTGLAISAISSTSVSVTWVAGGSETQWQWACVAAGAEVESWSEPVSEATATASGLAAESHYDFYVRAYCDAVHQSEGAKISDIYTGHCIPAPTSVDGFGITGIAFDGASQSAAVHRTSAPYYANNSAIAYNLLAGEEAKVSVTYSTGYTYGTVIWVDWNNDLTFGNDEVVYTGTSTNSKPTTLECLFDVPAAQPEGNYRMRIGGADSYFDNYISYPSSYTADPCGTGTYCVYEDYTITILPTPTCLKPTNLAEGVIGAHSVELSWTENGSATEWQICLNDDEEHLIDANANLFLLEGLDANTAYSIKVRANCAVDDQSAWSNVINIHTACEAITIDEEHPFSENFDDLAIASAYTPSARILPDCWSAINTCTYADYKNYPTAYYYSYTDYSNSTPNSMRFYSYYSSYSSYYDPQDQYAILPQISNYINTLRMKFNARAYNTGSSYDATFSVGVMTDPADPSTFVAVASFNPASTTYAPFEAKFNSYSGNGNYIAIKMEAANSTKTYRGLYLDDIVVELIPNCLEPSGLAVSAITASGATFSWDAIEGDAWKYAIAPASAAAPAEGEFTAIATNQLEKNDLSDNTDYIFYLRRDCGSAMSEAISIAFHTLQAPAAIPFADDFENGNEWNFINGNLTNQWVYGEAANNGGTHALYISNDGGASNAYSHEAATVYATKAFSFESGKYIFQYDWKANGESSYDYLRVALVPASVVMTAGTALPSGVNTTSLPSTWIALDGGSKLNLQSGWQTFASAELDIPAGNYNVVLLWRNDGGGGSQTPAAVDNFSITRITCIKPTDVEASGSTASSAVISWTAGGEESAWEIVYSTEADFDPNAAALTDAMATSITLDELSAETTYYLYVRANCGEEDKSAWSNRISFTTAAACQTPDGLSAADITASSASISWNDYGQSGFKLRYSEDGTNWTEVPGVSSPQLIEGLDANTAYHVQVQVGCDAEAWSETLNFKTACDVYSIATDGDYVEDFNSYTGSISTNATAPSAYPNDELPECWQFLNRSANTSSYPQVFISSNSGYPVSGKCLFFKSSSTTPLYAILPKFAESTASLQLKFTYRNEGTSASNGTLYAGYMADPSDATTFNPVLTCEQTTTLTEKELFFEGAPEGSYIAFKYQGGSYDNYYLSIDNVSVSLAPTCFKPSALTIDGITTNSATLSWTNGKDESEWQICVNDDEENLIDASANSFPLENLNPNTAYSVKVRAKCGGSDVSEWSEAVSFTTNCVAITALPWEENFNDMAANTVPGCWDNSASTVQEKTLNPERVWGVYENSGNKMIRMFNYNVHTGEALINTPSIVLPPDGKYELTFDYSNRANCGAFSVKVSTDGGASFTAIDGASYAAAGTTSSTDPGTFSSAAIDLSDYADNTIILQFFANANYSQGAIFVDNISLHVKAPCSEAPTALSAATADANSINLSWTKGEDEEAWQARYRVAGTSAWTVVLLEDVTVSGTGCSATLSGLEAETTYEVQVQAYCDAEHQSEWTASAVASTACGVKALPYIENFDGLSVGIPACWDNSDGTTDNDSYKWSYVAAGHEGSAVRFNSFNNPSGKTNLLKTPAIRITDAAALTFWYKNETGGDFSVLYSIDGDASEVLASALPNQANWTEHTCPLPDACIGHEVVLIFKGTSNNSYGNEPYIYLDEVSVVRGLTLNDNTDLTAVLEQNKGVSVDITINRTFFRKDYFNTICLPFDLPSFDGTPFDVPGAEVWAFKYGYVENGELLIRIAPTEGIVAGIPYLIRFDDAAEDIVNPTFHSVVIKESVGKSVGQNDDVRFIGILKPEYFVTTGDDVHKKLFLLTNNRLAWAGTANNLKSFRAFFLTKEDVGGAPVSNNMPARIITRDQVATGMDEVQNDQNVIKLLENDHVVIIRNGVKYSVQGQIIEKR